MCEISIEVFWVFAYLMNVHLFSHTLLKSLYFSPLTSIIFSFKKPINQVKCMNLFQELYSIPFIYVLIHYGNTACLDYCSFIIRLEIR